jgi:hypothetical protein
VRHAVCLFRPCLPLVSSSSITHQIPFPVRKFCNRGNHCSWFSRVKISTGLLTGYNVRFLDPPKVLGKKSEHKPWKSAVISKFRESASQYQTAQSGISYIKAWLTSEPSDWELINTFIQSNPESSTPKAILSELDEVHG